MAKSFKAGEKTVDREGGGFILPGIGKHVVRITSAKLETVQTQKGEKEFVEVNMVVLVGPSAGGKIREQFWLTDNSKTYDRFGDFVMALGVKEGTDIDPNAPAPYMVGRTVRVNVGHKDREYQGQTYTDAVLQGYVAWEPLTAKERAEYPSEEFEPGDNDLDEDLPDGAPDDDDLDDLPWP